MNRIGTSIAGVMLVVALNGTAAAQGFPSKPVRMILPYPPGSALDVAARALAQEMSKDWAQAVVTENRPGASSIIAADACAKATADGYSLCLVSRATLSFVPNFYKKIPFDPAKDFEPIANMFDLLSVFTVHPSVKVNSVAELLALAKAKPGTLNFGSVGDGTPPHLVVEWIKKKPRRRYGARALQGRRAAGAGDDDRGDTTELCLCGHRDEPDSRRQAEGHRGERR